jgi:hypothetical protein
MEIGVTGSRHGLSERQLAWARAFLTTNKHSIAAVHHGDCVGADSEFHDLVREIVPTAVLHVHPPTNPLFRARKRGLVYPCLHYHTRNTRIIQLCTHLLAFPAAGRSTGTRWTIHAAQSMNRRTTVVRAQERLRAGTV